MSKIKILWVDDEIDILKPHIMFLEQKSYIVSMATNGIDALKMVETDNFDIIFLDENMPGISGIETLEKIKMVSPSVPVIMITKSEEENIMEEAIGSKITDFLIKPVNPNQILLVLKKIFEKQRFISQKVTSSYQSTFSKLGMEINETFDFKEWKEVYKKLVFWELSLSESDDTTMDEVLRMQQNEANNSFAKYIKKTYKSWFDTNNTNVPLLSPNLITKKIFPHLKNNEKVVFLVLDNLRFDQWKIIENLLSKYYFVDEEDLYYSILPTATQYSRNSIFSGLMPSAINSLYPDLWKNDDEEGGKNLYEEEMLQNLMRRHNIKASLCFEKLLDITYTKKFTDNLHTIMNNNQLVVLIVNFMDALSHASTDLKSIKELANSLNSYLAVTKSWFEHSNIFDILKILSKNNFKLVISTDHGSIRITNPVKIIGDKNTTTNLRFKQGKNLNYNPKEVFEILKPEEIQLPKTNITSSYVFTFGNDFFVYPNNYSQYVKYYKDSFQHGGISLEEMLIPAITLSPKKV